MSMFQDLRGKISSYFDKDPIAPQRDEFLGVNADTPVENKSHFTHEVVGAAAAYEAMKAFEDHEAQNDDGTKVTHARAKEIIAGLAAGFAIKMIEEKGLPFSSDNDKAQFVQAAQQTATQNSKRALRESGIYDQNELEPMDDDEATGQQGM